MLAELDDEVTEIFGVLDPATPVPIQPVPESRRSLMGRLHAARRPNPRVFAYPVTWNLPQPKPRPHISVLHVPRNGPARPTEMPRSLTWLPMLRGTVNAHLENHWKAWLGAWDRMLVVQCRLVRTMTTTALQGYRVQEMELTAKTTRTVEYFTRAVWEDYLSVFGAVEGTPGAHILHELGQLELLAT
jgi:hypothetical protein